MPTSSEFVAYCEAQYGKPYVWGSNGPDSFDCSGLIVSALWELGVLPRGDDRGSAALIEMARAIPVAEGVSTLGALLYRDGHIAVDDRGGIPRDGRLSRVRHAPVETVDEGRAPAPTFLHGRKRCEKRESSHSMG